MSEPPKKFIVSADLAYVFTYFLAKVQIYFFRNYRNNEQEEVKEIFFVRLCCDVFVEVLCYGNRCRLAKLERIGRRFHFGVKNFFAEMPFFRLNLQLRLGYFISL